jgi:hypothetical protein
MRHIRWGFELIRWLLEGGAARATRPRILPAFAAAGMGGPPPQGQPAPASSNTCLIVAIVAGVAAVMLFMVMGLFAALLLPALARAREAARRAMCANNEKMLGLVLKIYANDQPHGAWPALAPETGFLKPDWLALEE